MMDAVCICPRQARSSHAGSESITVRSKVGDLTLQGLRVIPRFFQMMAGW